MINLILFCITNLIYPRRSARLWTGPMELLEIIICIQESPYRFMKVLFMNHKNFGQKFNCSRRSIQVWGQLKISAAFKIQKLKRVHINEV